MHHNDFEWIMNISKLLQNTILDRLRWAKRYSNIYKGIRVSIFVEFECSSIHFEIAASQASACVMSEHSLFANREPNSIIWV